MSNNWVKIYSSTKIHLTEIVKAFLQDQGIKVFEINKIDSMYVQSIEGEIELYVNPENVIKAKHLISKHKL